MGYVYAPWVITGVHDYTTHSADIQPMVFGVHYAVH